MQIRGLSNRGSLKYALLFLSLSIFVGFTRCTSPESGKEASSEHDIQRRAESRTKVLSDTLQLDSIQIKRLYELHLKLERSLYKLHDQKDQLDKRVFKNELRKVILFTETEYKKLFSEEQYALYKKYRMRKSKNKNRMIRLKKKPEANHPAEMQ